MTGLMELPKRPRGRFNRWLLEDRIEQGGDPEAKEGEEKYPWWMVV